MRYREEFVLAILDIIGDLSPVGAPLRGHIVAVKPLPPPTALWPGVSCKRHASRWWPNKVFLRATIP